MTDDQKPMSAQEKARHVASTWINNLSDEVPEPDREQLEYFVATALREHAAEAVAAEREACARVAENALGWQGVPCTQAAAAIRARSEGGEGDG